MYKKTKARIFFRFFRLQILTIKLSKSMWLLFFKGAFTS